MKYKISQLTEDLKSSYWTYPLLMTAGALFFLILTINIDHSLSRYELWTEYLNYKIGDEQIHDILTTIITSIITITSVTLSITVLTLSIASNQLGPRLLPNFIRQGRTQFGYVRKLL